MGQKIRWWEVESALATSVVVVNGLARKKLEQAGFRSWGNVLVTGFREVCTLARLSEEESGALLLGLEQFNQAFYGKLRYELTFRSWYTVRIRARFMLKRVLDDEQYNRLLSTRVMDLNWTLKEQALLALLNKERAGDLCQARWESELLPASVGAGLTIEELRDMEDRFFVWSKQFGVGLVFDMDLPGPFSTLYPRIADPPSPAVSKEIAYQIARTRRRRLPIL